MGCFLACFGFTKRRKRPKNSSKIISEDQRYGRYVPLDSDVSVKLDIVEMPNPNASATKLSDKSKESSASKIKKKVSFNLNVKSYEPLPNDDYDTYLSEGEEKTVWEFNQEDRAGMSTLEFEEDSIASKIGSCSYPANYRYQNCRNSYDEEDEIELDESDFDEDDDDDNLDSDREDDGGNDDNKKLNSASVEVEELVASAQLAEERKCKLDQLQDSANQEMNRVESDQSARNRSRNVDSVLYPVENLTQWKAIKAKSRQQSKQQKENIASQQEQHVLLSHMKKSSTLLSSNTLPDLNHSKAMKHEIAVDASLSNWLS